MIPDRVVSTTPVPAPFLAPDDIPWQPDIDYEYGGVALNDGTQGLRVKIWQFRLHGEDVIVSAGDVEPVVLFTRSGITEISGCFDQNMNPTVGFVQNGQMVLWWFDTVEADQVFTEFDGHSPRVCMDDKRATQSAANDIILSYVESGMLKTRTQRDRFGTVDSLYNVGTYPLRNVGMNSVLRLQWQFNPEPV